MWRVVVGIWLITLSLYAWFYQDEMSNVEQEALNEALLSQSLRVIDEAQGKKIRHIKVYTQSPFLKEDGFLSILNVVHVDTRSEVIKKFILLQEGDAYDPLLAISSKRILQNPLYRTVVVIKAVLPKEEVLSDFVDLLIISRDIWSLHPAFDIAITGSVLNRLYVELIESNFLGKNKVLGAFASLEPGLWQTGLFYKDPLLFQTRHTLNIRPALVFDRQTGKILGSNGHFELGYPLYSPESKWGYNLVVDYKNQPILDFKNNKIRILDLEEDGVSYQVEKKYHLFEVKADAQVFYSLGDVIKHDFSFGYGLKLQQPRYLNEKAPVLSLEATSSYLDDKIKRTLMPNPEFQSYLIGSYHYFENNFETFHNLDTFELAEIMRVGPDMQTDLHVALRPFLRSDFNFLRLHLKTSYFWPFIKNAFWYNSIEAETRLQQKELMNNYLTFKSQIASPILFHGGRLVADFLMGFHVNHHDNAQFRLGGENGLRGIGASYYSGPYMMRANIEFRSLSTSIWIAHVGGVLFYDMGAAFSKFEAMDLTQNIGAGLRILLLEFDRNPVRIDYAIPLSGPFRGPQHGIVTLGMGQVF